MYVIINTVLILSFSRFHHRYVLRFCLREINTWIEVSLQFIIMPSLVQYMQSRTHTMPRNAHTKIPLTKIPTERYHPKYINQKIARKRSHPEKDITPKRPHKKTQSFPTLRFYTPRSHSTTETGFCKRQYPVSRKCCSFWEKCNRPDIYDISSVNNQWVEAAAHSGRNALD